jgi:tetratricopeptide (TPR) repeat protein
LLLLSQAIEFLQRALYIERNNGDVWSAVGHCYLMLEDLEKAYLAYQQALYHLPNPKVSVVFVFGFFFPKKALLSLFFLFSLFSLQDPNLWYGIGILYDRYSSFEHAEEAFAAVLKMEPTFEKANEIYFRLGIIYKQQAKYDQALEV